MVIQNSEHRQKSQINMPHLNLAVKATQATVIPPLLVATLVNNTQDANIEINFEDAAALKALELKGSEDAESSQLVMDDGFSVHGTVSVVRKLIELYPSLSTVHGNLVSRRPQSQKGSLLTSSDMNSKWNGSLGRRISFHRTTSQSRSICSSWIHTLLSGPTW